MNRFIVHLSRNSEPVCVDIWPKDYSNMSSPVTHRSAAPVQRESDGSETVNVSLQES